MKNLFLVLTLCLAALIIGSCKKSTQKPAAISINGNWSLVSDSGFSASYDNGGIGYKGTSSDHYNFQADGKLTWHENGVGSDSASYSLKSKDTITIAYFPKSNPNYSAVSTASYIIKELTANKMVLSLMQIATPGGIFGGTIILSR